jgi:hypothetical protein
VQMKDGIYVALICFAVVPIYTQNSTTRADKTNIEATSTPVKDYADQVNGLLRDIHTKLQEIFWAARGRRIDSSTSSDDEACGNSQNDCGIGCDFSGLRCESSIEA